MNNTYKILRSIYSLSFIVILISFLSILQKVDAQIIIRDQANVQGKSYINDSSFDHFFSKADTLDKKRFNTSVVFSTTAYTGFSIGLYYAWYKNYEQEAFHFFNDNGEWRSIDKVGHFYTAYFQGVLCYKGAKWTGLNQKKSILTGFILGSLFQSTIEVMDGFSSNWGFSTPDMIMNLAGSSTFVLQQKIWNEQRITFKISNIPRPYDNTPIQASNSLAFSSLERRAADLYGTQFQEQFLKDYNSQVYWACINPDAFIGDYVNIPKWLNIAVGYGVGNIYGGYTNAWNESGNNYKLPTNKYPRYSSFYLSPDINLSNIRTRSYFVNTLLDIFDIFKIPLPAIEYNTLGEFKFHFFI